MTSVMRQSGQIEYIKDNVEKFNMGIRRHLDQAIMQINDYNIRIKEMETY